MIGLVFCHGWGLSPDYWRWLRPLLRPHPQKYWNLGYFGKMDIQSDLDASIQWIGIGHSLGFAKLVSSSLPWAGLVSICGFTYFDTLSAKRTFDAFSQSPSKVLADFYERCGLEKMKGTFDYHRLKKDLQWLIDINVKELLKSKNLPVLVLAEDKDPIVPWSLTIDCFADLPKTSIIQFAGRKHSLGYHAADWCAKRIENFIDEQNKNC